MNVVRSYRLCLLMLACLLWVPSWAQRSEIRKKIDEERSGANTQFQDEKSYEQARRFIRLDSTYYVGHMLMGAFFYFRANDELGFKKAIAPLQKAMDLMERDFDPILRIRTNNYQTYVSNYRFQYDYGLITYFLNHSYQNVEMQTEAMEVLYHVRNRNFQIEHVVSSYNTMAWMVHRNRVYTSAKYPFLKNSVMENVNLANKYLDSALLRLVDNAPYNNGLFDPAYLNRQYLSTFHYKAMIYDYKLDIDSATYFYEELIRNNAYSSNNYAEFRLAMGDFETAEEFFREAEDQDRGVEKNTKEFYYMRGTLEIYKSNPQMADTLLNEVLLKQGSSPGYGWHCIGLARAQHYEGLTAESQERNNKAARFQELHIGTTWGQEQYNMAVASLNYMNQLRFRQEYMFENDEWYFWLNPVNWYRWLKYKLEIRHHKMVLASLVAGNPERDQAIYTIFSPENLLTFDEVWNVIDGFGNEYFIKVYERLLKEDKRPLLKKYFRYFLGKLYLAEGKEDIAIKYFKEVLSDEQIKDPYQGLLRARIFEALAEAGDDSDTRVLQMYKTFPELVPFSDLTMRFRLQVDGAEATGMTDIIDDMRSTRVEWDGGSKDPIASLRFEKLADATIAHYAVTAGDASLVSGSFRIDDSNRKEAGKLLAYRFFNVSKEKIGEKPKVIIKEEPVNKPTEEKEKVVAYFSVGKNVMSM